MSEYRLEGEVFEDNGVWLKVVRCNVTDCEGCHYETDSGLDCNVRTRISGLCSSNLLRNYYVKFVVVNKPVVKLDLTE